MVFLEDAQAGSNLQQYNPSQRPNVEQMPRTDPRLPSTDLDTGRALLFTV